jgi:predicted membrane channel-forming protein YqfA (hemolysin III family)
MHIFGESPPRSLLDLHNETVNIWTHLIGFLIFCVLFIRDIFLVFPSFRKESLAVADILVLIGVLVCYQECI